MGVVVRMYIDILTIIINFPYSTCISSFLGTLYTKLHDDNFHFFLFLFFSKFNLTLLYRLVLVYV